MHAGWPRIKQLATQRLTSAPSPQTPAPPTGFGAPAPSTGTRNISNVGTYNANVHGQTITYNNTVNHNPGPSISQAGTNNHNVGNIQGNVTNYYGHPPPQPPAN